MFKKIATLIGLLIALAAVTCLPTLSEQKEIGEKDPFVRDILSDRKRPVIEQELVDLYCEAYRAGLRRGRTRCGKDLHPHCMVNGSVILGSCRLKRAVCVEGVLEDFDWLSCSIP